MSKEKGLSRIIIYGAEYCAFCSKAKLLLNKSNIPFSYKDMEDDETMQRVGELQKIHHYTTIPMIFVGNQFIGGYA